MKINVIHHYDQDVDTVFRAFSTEDFYVKKFTECGARDVEVLESDRDEGRYAITTKRQVPADAPSVLKSILGEWNTITQTEEWEGSLGEEYYSELKIDAEGVPVTIRGTMNLQSEGDGCVNDVELDIQCGVPLIGKKLAEFVAADTKKTLDAEHEFIKRYLSGD